MEKILKNILQKIDLIKDGCTFQEIRESSNNKVYEYYGYIIKLSQKPFNLMNECEILRRLDGKGKFPKVVHFETITNYEDDHIGKKVLSFNEYKKGEIYHETGVIRQDPVGIKSSQNNENELFVLITKKLPGKGLKYEWDNLQEGQKNNIINDIINHIKTIHSIKSDHENYKIAIQKTAKENYIKNTNNPFISQEELGELYHNFLINLGKFIDSENEYVIHNDLWYENILVENGELSGIVDFETSVYGPVQLELFRLIQHKFFAQNEIDSGKNHSKTELSFIDMLFDGLKKQYPQLFIFNNEQLFCYNVNTYLRLLAQYNDEWFNYEEIKEFKSIFIDGALKKCPIC